MVGWNKGAIQREAAAGETRYHKNIRSHVLGEETWEQISRRKETRLECILIIVLFLDLREIFAASSYFFISVWHGEDFPLSSV